MSLHTLPVDGRAWYLAGPMTGIPQFNFPAFMSAAEDLRSMGKRIISPAELDFEENEEIFKVAMSSDDGAFDDGGMVAEHTWGDFLSRDVKIVADQCKGIIFLNGWQESRGARLEAFVGSLCGHQFAHYRKGVPPCRLTSQFVLHEINKHTHAELT